MLLTPLPNPQCLAETGFLVDYFGKNTPLGRDTGSTGFLQFLLSNMNRNGFRQLSDIVKSGVVGKKRGFRLIGHSPMCWSVCATEFTCNDQPTPYTSAINYYEGSIDTRYTPCDANGDPMALTMTEAEMLQYCEIDNGQFFLDMQAKYDLRFAQELDKIFLQGLLSSSTVKTLPFFLKNANTQMLELNSGWELLMADAISSVGLIPSDYVLVGGLFAKALQTRMGYTTMSTEGLIETRGTYPLYYDRNVDAVFGKNAFLAIPKGAVQLAIFNENEGDNSFSDSRFMRQRKAIPIGNGEGIPVDYYWEKDPKCNKIEYLPSVYAEMITAVPGSCANGTDNGIFVFQDCNSDILGAC
jgi:hypothetical protein